MNARGRSRAREIALRALYQMDIRNEFDARGAVAALAGPRVPDYAREVVDGIVAHRGEIDGRVCALAENWDWGRMAVVDRNVLRIGAYEILHRDDVPPKVAIDEAIELAKRYSTENSGGFVNGILDRVMAGRDTHK